MGKLARIAELEKTIEALKERCALAQEVIDYVRAMAAMPEDAVLLYTASGMRVSHEIGKSARVLLGRLQANA